MSLLTASVVDSLVEGDRCAKQRLERHRARDVGGTPESARVDERDECYGRVRLGSIDQGDAFLRREDDRLGADLTQELRRRILGIPLDQRSLTDESEAEMREGRQITARPHAPLLRNGRIDIGIQHLENEIDELGTRARVALRDHISAEKHHRSHLALGEAITDSRRVAANDIHLQLGQFVARDRDFRKFSKAGGDPVHDQVALHDVVDDGAGTEHSFARLRREPDANPIGRHRISFIDGERVTVDENFFTHFFFLPVRRAWLRGFDFFARGDARLLSGRGFGFFARGDGRFFAGRAFALAGPVEDERFFAV